MAIPLRIVALLFPNVTQLDLMGPVQVFSRLPDATVDLVWHRLEPISTDAGFCVLPTTTFTDAPQADVLMVPGGQGAFDLLDDAPAIDFIRRQALDARYITSVCTGAFPLGAAGLIDGKRATTHWASHSMLSEFGAIPEQRRVVQDGNVITAGGVTSGIDFALSVAAELCGADTARAVQLALEYDPPPPFDAGTPTRPEADPDQVARTIERSRAERGPVVARATARLRTMAPHFRVVVDGQVFDVTHDGGSNHLAWVNAPNPGYGFSVGLNGATLTRDEARIQIQGFLASIDPATGYVEE
ncbi:DJ-1/PfpI family protein [Microbacterium aurantiacum]|uniref:DJ-1/PfpI family protein n=1 Tax=Microbacterium aurantiacum TaxID=162393 RepID=UPI0007DA53D1|nr:DJ-1/PfpI family protein [Microbacterium chocolatum]ANG84752.1 hypothetical protein A8L33_04525 [Microbacterium chocolatum]